MPNTAALSLSRVPGVSVARWAIRRALSGSHTRTSDPPLRAPANRRGATPAIVIVTPFTFSVRPITSLALSKYRSQIAWLMTAASSGEPWSLLAGPSLPGSGASRRCAR